MIELRLVKFVLNSSIVLQTGVIYLTFRKLQLLLIQLRYANTIYIENTKPKCSHFDLCIKYTNLTQIVLKLIVFISVVLIVTIALPTIIEYFLTKRLIPMMYIHFIGMEHYLSELIILVNIFNFVVLLLEVVISLIMESLLLTTLINMSFIAQISKRQLNDFSEKLECGTITPTKCKEMIIEMIKMNKKYKE